MKHLLFVLLFVSTAVSFVFADTSLDVDTRSPNYFNGTGMITGNGTGKGFTQGTGIINLTDFTGKFSYNGTPKTFVHDSCTEKDDFWNCEQGQVRLDSNINQSLTFSFRGDVNHFRVQGEGKTWVDGFNNLTREYCVTPVAGLKIKEDTLLCKGSYNFGDYYWAILTVIGNGVTLNCQDAELVSNRELGIVVQAENVTITHCNLLNHYRGIETYSNGTVIQDNFFSNNVDGIVAWNYGWNGQDFSYLPLHNIKVINNSIINTHYWGIALNYVDGWEISGNHINTGLLRSSTSIRLVNSTSGLTYSNTIEQYNTSMFVANKSSGLIYHNNFISNIVRPIVLNHNSSFIWNNYDEGNYWSNYDSLEEGCTDTNDNRICDYPYIIDPTNIDYYPFTQRNGWLFAGNRTF